MKILGLKLFCNYPLNNNCPITNLLCTPVLPPVLFQLSQGEQNCPGQNWAGQLFLLLVLV